MAKRFGKFSTDGFKVKINGVEATKAQYGIMAAVVVSTILVVADDIWNAYRLDKAYNQSKDNEIEIHRLKMEIDALERKLAEAEKEKEES